MDATKKLLDVSAEKNRNLLIVFMAYLATATVLALSITDLDLLLDQKNIQIPLLSVGLPMWAFYTVIPFLLVLLHFNVLQNTQEHNKKREAWLAHKPIDPGTQLFPYLLDFAKVRYGLDATPNVASKLVAAGTWVIYVYLPLLVLAIFFIRFADLQGVATSSWHLALGAIDIYLLFNFWRRLRGAEQPPVSAIRWLSHFSLILLGLAVLWTLALFSYIQLLHFDSSYSQKPINNAIALEDKLQQIGSIAIVPRISAPNARPYQVKDDHIRLDKWLNPDKEEGELWQSSPPPLDWNGKRLAFANLKNSQFRRVDLLRADLQGANLREAQLQGAILWNAQLQGANLRETQLQGANLREAQLQGAILFGAQLQGANLREAQLQGAILFGAQLQGANLLSTQLQGADLQKAQLQGAELRGAQLQGADLWGAQLQGADLLEAQLQGADLQEAQLQDAALWRTQLQGADLQKAQLQGADLWRAQLQGANLTDAQLQGANLTDAQLQGTNLWEAQLQGADLWGAQLQGADLSGAEVLGVYWKGSKTERMLALGLDRNTSFDFASYTAKLSIDNGFKKRMSEAAKRQNEPPSVPTPLGTQDPAVYKKTWLSLLCQNHDSHKGMLEYHSFLEQIKMHLIPKQTILDYVEQTPSCEPYRTMTVSALDSEG